MKRAKGKKKRNSHGNTNITAYKKPETPRFSPCWFIN